MGGDQVGRTQGRVPAAAARRRRLRHAHDSVRRRRARESHRDDRRDNVWDARRRAGTRRRRSRDARVFALSWLLTESGDPETRDEFDVHAGVLLTNPGGFACNGGPRVPGGAAFRHCLVHRMADMMLMHLCDERWTLLKVLAHGTPDLAHVAHRKNVGFVPLGDSRATVPQLVACLNATIPKRASVAEPPSRLHTNCVDTAMQLVGACGLEFHGTTYRHVTRRVIFPLMGAKAASRAVRCRVSPEGRCGAPEVRDDPALDADGDASDDDAPDEKRAASVDVGQMRVTTRVHSVVATDSGVFAQPLRADRGAETKSDTSRREPTTTFSTSSSSSSSSSSSASLLGAERDTTKSASVSTPAVAAELPLVATFSGLM